MVRLDPNGMENSGKFVLGNFEYVRTKMYYYK